MYSHTTQTHRATCHSSSHPWRGRVAAALAGLAVAAFGLPAAAAIPLAERQVLIDLYNSTSGDGWFRNNGWKTAGDFSAPGTECTWYGVSCDSGGNRVTGLNLNENNPVGPLPASLNTLKALQFLWANTGHLAGPLPTLDGLTALREVTIQYHPQLSGPIPDLAGLTALETFDISNTQVSGPIPPLTGLPVLRRLSLDHNQLSGPIPSLNALPALQGFYVVANQLSGTPPAAPASLTPGLSGLCPNLLHTPSPSDTAWNTATADTPWSAGCTPGYLVSGVSMYGYGGRFGPPQGVQGGQTATLEIIPDPNYVIGTVFSDCGGTRAGNLFTTGPVNADCEVRAQFLAALGTIVPTRFWTPPNSGFVRCTPALPGEPSVCTATPASGFRLQSIEGCGGAPGTTSPYTTAPLTEVCTVSVRFEAAAVTPVPTLGQWALMALGLMMAGFGVRRVRRLRRLRRLR